MVIQHIATGEPTGTAPVRGPLGIHHRREPHGIGRRRCNTLCRQMVIHLYARRDAIRDCMPDWTQGALERSGVPGNPSTLLISDN